MVENKYYDVHEAIKLLEKGKIAISIHSDVKDEFSTILGLDNKGWIWIKYPHNKFATYNINMRKEEGIPGKRFIIINAPDNFEIVIKEGKTVIYKDTKYIYKNGKPYEVEKEAIIKDDESEEN